MMMRWLRIIFVVGLLANTADYNTYVTQLVLTAVPQWFASVFGPAASVTSPASQFDQALGAYWAACMNIHPSGWANSMFMSAVEFSGLVIVFTVLAVMFVAFVVVQVLTALLLLVAPLILLGLMFDFTLRYVTGLVNALVKLAISTFFVNALVAILTNVVVQIISSVQVSQNSWDTAINLFAGVGTIVILGMLVPIAAQIVESIAGAAHVGPRIPNPVAPAAAAGSVVAGVATGPAAAAQGVARVTAPVGRSLSSRG